MNDLNYFLKFSKPFIDALKETFSLMIQTEIKAHSPKLKTDSLAYGDITAMIGMSGTVVKDSKESPFNGLLVLSWPENIYVKMASRMLMEEYQEFCDDIYDTGAEISNIVMGNAKKVLKEQGFNIGLATPTTVRGKGHMVKYPTNSTIIAVTISCDLGDFTMELCYQETSA